MCLAEAHSAARAIIGQVLRVRTVEATRAELSTLFSTTHEPVDLCKSQPHQKLRPG